MKLLFYLFFQKLKTLYYYYYYYQSYLYYYSNSQIVQFNILKIQIIEYSSPHSIYETKLSLDIGLSEDLLNHIYIQSLFIVRLQYEEKRSYKPEEWFADVTSVPLNQHDRDQFGFKSQVLQCLFGLSSQQNQDYWGQNPKQQVTLASIRAALQGLIKSLIALFTIPEDHFEAKKENFFNQEVFWIAEKLSKVLENRNRAVAEEILRIQKPEAFATLVGLKKDNENFANLAAIKKYRFSDKMIARPFYPHGMNRWGWVDIFILFYIYMDICLVL
ncbi:unnamed protein product [Paramecium octaurelia]|uniref:Uncharacterized protein n=1 Tax=Paramecium octaurelia TaxID=43137 RepID=A0A8S1WWK2_PAROT|nr:unnamed protein product [Paramecium octaurelia]